MMFTEVSAKFAKVVMLVLERVEVGFAVEEARTTWR